MQQSGPSSGNPTTWGISPLRACYVDWWYAKQRRESQMSNIDDRIIVAREPEPTPNPEPEPTPEPPTPRPE